MSKEKTLVCSRRKQREIDGQYARIAVKKILPICFLGLWLVAMALVYWVAYMPSRWKTDTITFSRLSQVEVSLGRSSRSTILDVIIAEDGRHFSLSEAELSAVTGKLSPGEPCEIVYAHNPLGLGPEVLEGLVTGEDGVLVSVEESRASVYAERQGMWWLVGIPSLACVVVEVWIEVFGCRKERAQIARLKAKQAKFTAREACRRACKENNRAGM